MTTTPQSGKRQVARAAALVMGMFAISRALGLIRQIVFSLYFGAGAEMDAYVAAQRIPEMLFLIIAGGALGAAFIPTFSTRLTQEGPRSAWQLASAVINLLLVILVPLSVLFILIAPWLVRTLVAPELPPDVQARTAELMRVMLLSVAVFGVSGIVMGILNAQQHFLLPALAPILYNVALIGGAAWGGLTDIGMMGPAIATVVGACLHLGVQVPGLLHYHARYVPTLGLHDPGVRRVGQLMGPRVLGVAAVQINIVVTNSLASGLGSGAIASFDYAWKLMLLPLGIFAQAVGTAAFPTFSAQAARGEFDALRETVTSTMRTVIAITLPASVGLAMLGHPLIAMIFQHGAFNALATREVTWALACLSVGLIGHALIEVLARTFYALHNTWTPAAAATGAVLVNLGLGLTLPRLFFRTAVPPIAGLALANAAAALVEMLILLTLISRALGGLDHRGLLSLSGRVLLSSGGMAGVLWGWLSWGPVNVWVQGLAGMTLGLLAYALCAYGLQITEFWDAARLLRR